MVPKHRPVAEPKMLGHFKYYTTCQVLREAYLLLDRIRGNTDAELAKEKIRLAMAMAKETAEHLYKYEPNYLEQIFDMTEDIRNESLR
jgi:hypothetical protein